MCRDKASLEKGYCLPAYHDNKGDGPNEAPDEIIIHSEPATIKEAGPGRERQRRAPPSDPGAQCPKGPAVEQATRQEERQKVGQAVALTPSRCRSCGSRWRLLCLPPGLGSSSRPGSSTWCGSTRSQTPPPAADRGAHPLGTAKRRQPGRSSAAGQQRWGRQSGGQGYHR